MFIEVIRLPFTYNMELAITFSLLNQRIDTVEILNHVVTNAMMYGPHNLKLVCVLLDMRRII
jgi:hypothetical protein